MPINIADQIPKIKESSIFIPTKCPECDSDLILSNTGIDLCCPNTASCPAQVVGRLSYFCGRNLGNITGLSDKTLEKLMTKYKVIDICDLYDLSFVEISNEEGFGARSVEKLQESINNSKTILDYKFLAGLGIDGLGIEMAKVVCEIL
jgi:DNA ligase (NAD+)